MTNYSNVTDMRTFATGETDRKSIGGYVDYFYIGSYENNNEDDLDCLISQLLQENITGGCSSCTGGCSSCTGGAYMEKEFDNEELVVTRPIDDNTGNVSEPLVVVETADITHIKDKDNDSLVVIRNTEPLIVDTTPNYEDGIVLKTVRNTPLNRPVPREVIDVFNDNDLVVNKPRVHTTTDTKGGNETDSKTRGDNVKIEYKKVVEFIEKYANTIKNTDT